MKTNTKNSFLKDVPSGVLAFFILIGATIILFASDAIMSSFDKVGIIAYIINVILPPYSR